MLEDIFQSVVDGYRSDPDKFACVSQVSDLAKERFLETFEAVKDHPQYEERIAIEAPIYARYLLMELSLRFAKCG